MEISGGVAAIVCDTTENTVRCDPFNPHRGVPGPFGPKVGNGVENEPAPVSKKLQTESKKESKKSKKS